MAVSANRLELLFHVGACLRIVAIVLAQRVLEQAGEPFPLADLIDGDPLRQLSKLV